MRGDFVRQCAFMHGGASMPTHRTSLNRRRVVLAGSALLGAAALPRVAAATGGDLAPAADFLAATRKFLAALEPDKLKAASFAWDGPEWRGWNYFGAAGYIKPGLRLEQMNAAQKAAAWDLLGVLFSPAGLEKTRHVMLLQDVLAASGNGTGQRSSQRFSFAIYGTPAGSGAWGFRLEGHHLTQSISVRDGRIVSVTPSSFSALPNRITTGKHAGLVTLKDEETLARRLAADLAKKPGVKQSDSVRDGQIVSVTPSSFSALPNRITTGKHAGLVTLKDEEALGRRLFADLAPTT